LHKAGVDATNQPIKKLIPIRGDYLTPQFMEANKWEVYYSSCLHHNIDLPIMYRSYFSQCILFARCFLQEWDKESWVDLVSRTPAVMLSDKGEFTNGVMV
jgi:hypothetical protein